MQDNVNEQGRDSMDELIERLKKQAEAPANTEAPVPDSSSDDELRRLLMGQLASNSDSYERSTPSSLSLEGVSLDEFEEEEITEEIEEEIFEQIEEEILEEEVSEEIEEEILEEEVFEEIEDEIFEEEISEKIEEEIFEEELSEEIEEEIFEEEVSEEIENEPDEAVAQQTPVFAFSSTPYDEEDDGEELVDEAQIAIDLFDEPIDTEGGNKEDDYHGIAHLISGQHAPSTDAFINGTTADDMLTDDVLASLDAKTRARLLGEEYYAPAAIVPTPDELTLENDDGTDEIPDEESEDIIEDITDDMQATAEDVAPATLASADPLQMGFDNEQSDASQHTADSTQSEEVSDTDVEMLLRLGYGTSLRRTVGDARVERIRQENIEKESVDPRAKTPFAYRKKEYGGRAMTASTQKAYARDRSVCLARIFYTLILALIMLIYDELPLIIDMQVPLKAELSGFVGSVYYPLLGIALLLVSVIPSLPLLFSGTVSALRLEPSIYTLPAVAIIASAVNNVGYLFHESSDIPAFFGVAALCILLIALVSDLALLKAQELAFSVVSSGKEKFLLANVEQFSVDNDGGSDGDSYHVRRTAEVGSYFARTAKYSKVHAFLNYIIPISLGASVIAGGLALLSGGGGLTFALRSAATAYFLMTPGLFALGTALPLLFANKTIFSHGCAVIGEAAADDYSPDTRFGKGKKIFFSDGDALTAAYVKRISLRGDADTEHYVALANKLFYVLGGVLSPEYQGAAAQTPDVSDVNIEIAESREHYLKLYMIDGDESVEIIMGSYDRLTRSGVKLPNENMEKIYNDDKRDRLAVYLAFDGQFRLAYSIQYKLSAKFRRTAKQLIRMGFAPSIETYDPMVTPQMLAEIYARDILGSELEICRADHFDGARPARSCGIVATGNSLRLFYPLACCEQMRRAYGKLKGLTTTLACVGFAAISVILLTNTLVFLRPWMVTLWQILFGGICALAVARQINRHTLSQASQKKIRQKPKATTPHTEQKKKDTQPRVKKRKKTQIPKKVKGDKGKQK